MCVGRDTAGGWPGQWVPMMKTHTCPYSVGSASSPKALRASPMEVPMPKLVMTHAVADIEAWLKGKHERAAALGAVGTNVTDHVAADGSNNVAITADVPDVEAAQSML